MKITNIPFLNQENNLTSHVIPDRSNSISPLIDISIEDFCLNIHICFNELNKRDILIDYINNFLVLKLSFSPSFSNEILNLKRIFYYKNLDFYNYEVEKLKNIVFLKIPFIIQA